ncbi:hypothetical protein [Rhizobium redzepovicii]
MKSLSFRGSLVSILVLVSVASADAEPLAKRILGNQDAQAFQYDGIEASLAMMLRPSKSELGEPPQAMNDLISKYEVGNDTCWGSPEDADKSCIDARTLGSQIHSAGFCYGRKDDIMADQVWRKCGYDSNEYEMGAERLSVVCRLDEPAEISLEIVSLEGLNPSPSVGLAGVISLSGDKNQSVPVTYAVTASQTGYFTTLRLSYTVPEGSRDVAKALHDKQVVRFPIGDGVVSIIPAFTTAQEKRQLGSIYQACR